MFAEMYLEATTADDYAAGLDRMAEFVSKLGCIACRGATGGLFGMWSPSWACRRDELGIDPHRPATFAYPVCPACRRRSEASPEFVARIEREIIRRARAALGRSGRRHRRQFVGRPRLHIN